MSNVSVSDLVSSARAGKGWSRQELADATGYSAVMIAKIESGERVPDERRIPRLAQALGLESAALAQAVNRSDRRKSGAPKLVDGMRLAKQNGDRATSLKSRAEDLKRQADQAAAELDERVREFDHAVVVPVAGLLPRIKDLPADVIAHGEVEPDHSEPEFSGALENAQTTTSRSIYALLQAGVLGNGVTSMATGAPTAALATGASIASAASSAAIGTLVDVAATSVNAGAMGRAATAGMGVATGTRALTPIVVFPVLAAATAAALASGGRLLAKQQSIQRQIDEAEENFDKNAEVVRRFVGRASSIGEVLSVAVMASRYHRRTIEGGAPASGEIAWPELDPRVQASVRRLAEIMLAGFTAVALPIGMNLTEGVTEEWTSPQTPDAESVPRLSPALEVGPEAENEYIDYVIRQALAQVAR